MRTTRLETVLCLSGKQQMLLGGGGGSLMNNFEQISSDDHQMSPAGRPRWAQ